MMKKITTIYIAILILTAVLLSSCQPQPVPGEGTDTKDQPAATVVIKTEKPTATVVPTETTEPTETIDPMQKNLDQAEEVVRSYFDAVSNGDSDQAAEYLSRFSLMVFEMTRDDAVSALQTQKVEGISWSALEVNNVEAFDDQSILISVAYVSTQPVAEAEGEDEASESSTPVQAVWVVRLENNEWLLNWNNLIDFKTMSAGADTVNGVTVLPTQILRYTDRIELVMLVQNRNNESVVFGQSNETLGTFYFGEKAVVAEKTQWVLNALRSSPGRVLEVKGLYEAYPDRIEIRKWNNYNVDPWYNFLLN
ncbi:MAG: hypothetical protein JEZ00_11030 [Anaerolineaceae bacterium]|nr:hypothetical protein [Anaerolineaceae bacterium]